MDNAGRNSFGVNADKQLFFGQGSLIDDSSFVYRTVPEHDKPEDGKYYVSFDWRFTARTVGEEVTVDVGSRVFTLFDSVNTDITKTDGIIARIYNPFTYGDHDKLFLGSANTLLYTGVTTGETYHFDVEVNYNTKQYSVSVEGAAPVTTGFWKTESLVGTLAAARFDVPRARKDTGESTAQKGKHAEPPVAEQQAIDNFKVGMNKGILLKDLTVSGGKITGITLLPLDEAALAKLAGAAVAVAAYDGAALAAATVSAALGEDLAVGKNKTLPFDAAVPTDKTLTYKAFVWDWTALKPQYNDTIFVA
jgi:hypothetical protein